MKLKKPIAGEKQAEKPQKFGIYVHSRFSMNMRYFVSHRQSRQGFISLWLFEKTSFVVQPLVNNECFNTVNISSVNESGLPIGLRSPGNKTLFLHLWRAEIAFWKNAKAYIRDSTNTAWR